MMTLHTLAFIGGFGGFGGRGGGGISIFLIFMLIMFVLRMTRGSRGGGRWGGGGGRWGGGYGPYNRPQNPWSQIKPQTPPPPPPVVPGEEEQSTQNPYYSAPSNTNYSEGTGMGAETVRTDSAPNAETRRVDSTTGKPIYSSDDPTAYGEPTRDLSNKPETPRARVTKPYSFDDDDDTNA